jgi:hypothetical protein
MSVARATACAWLDATRRAISDFKLHDRPLAPGNEAHNAAVRIIRNGLAVQCFNILEDFVKARTREALAAISAAAVQFGYLPEALQRATTWEAIKAIDVQLKGKEKADRVAFAQLYTAMIASTATSPMQLLDIAFFHTGSNISKDQFRDALSAFAVDMPWAQLSGISSRLGLSGLPAENVFVSLAQRRHQAAHNAASAVSEADLIQSIRDVYGLAIGFDVLLSIAAFQLTKLNVSQPPGFRTVVSHSQIPMRFIRPQASGFAEIKEGNTRSTRRNKSAAALVPGATTRARKENGVVVVFDSGGEIVEWQL